MKILHLIPSLDYCGAAAQLGLLSKHLPQSHAMHVCCLGGEGPWAQRLRQQGRSVDCLNWTRVCDPTPPWKLHRLLKSLAPDVIHAWGVPALRALGLIGRRWLPRTLVSQPLPHRRKQMGPLDRWLLRRVRAVVASSQAEAALCHEVGVRNRHLVVVPPGVEVVEFNRKRADSQNESILCIGALEARKGFRDAIWAFDILHYVFGDARLLLVGDGPQRADLHRFADGLEMSDHVDFLGWRDDVPELLHDADVCWAPTVACTSRQVVLESMAAGCPVVAADRPDLRELILEGQTGFLVPAGDKVAICKRTRSLFRNPALARQIGEAARAHVAHHFAPATFAQRWTDQYAAPPPPPPLAKGG